MEPLETVIAARALLESVTPLKRDCGRACGAACCQSDEDGQGGMLLFPGEEALYASLPAGWAIVSDDAVISGGRLLVKGQRIRRKTPLLDDTQVLSGWSPILAFAAPMAVVGMVAVVFIEFFRRIIVRRRIRRWRLTPADRQ